MININTENLRDICDTAQNASDEVNDALSILEQITIHNDWGCREREEINARIQKCRTKVRRLQEDITGFNYSINVSTRQFENTENKIPDLFESVENILGAVLAIPVNTFRAPQDILEGIVDVAELKDISGSKISVINFEELQSGIKE